MAIENFAWDDEIVAGTKSGQARAARIKESRASANAGSGFRWSSPGCARQSK
jgi:hypothetical protein